MDRPQLPPIFHSVPTEAADAFAVACGQAAELGAGALVWARRADRLDCAVVLEPEAPTAQAVSVFHAAMLAMGDALGVLAPPAKPVQFGHPGQIVVDGSPAGDLRLAVGPESGGIPSWLVVGARVEVLGSPSRLDRTTLQEEGFVGIGAAELLEHYARHLLAWIDRWQDEGYDPIRAHWLARLVDARDVAPEFQAAEIPLAVPGRGC